MIDVLTRRKRKATQREGPVMIQAEIGVMSLQAKECQASMATTIG